MELKFGMLERKAEHATKRSEVECGAWSGGDCKPYIVSTCEVNRYQECRSAYDHCGKPYTYHVTIITYRDTYSDGSFKTYTAQS